MCLSKRDTLEIVGIVGFVLAIFSIWYSYYLSENAELEVWHELNKSKGRLTVWVKNKAIFRETGTVNFYRLEISDSKPHLQINSIKPNETTKVELEVNITERNISLQKRNVTYPKLAGFTLPYYKLYFATEKDASISYRINCDNCKSQGIIRRIPEYDIVEGWVSLMIINETFVAQGSIPIYRWVEFSLADVP